MKKQTMLSSDEELGFNPGMDLMISLFAMSLLIMLVGMFFYNGVIAVVNEDVEDKAKEILQLQQQIEQLEQEMEKLLSTDKDRKQLLLENSRLRRQLERLKEKLAEQEEIILKIGQIDIEEVRKNQMEIVNQIAAKYNREFFEIKKNEYGISIDDKSDIIIKNDVTIQRFSFGSSILFGVNDTKLEEDGEKVLTIVGKTFKEKLDVIQEIQIQGHADPRNSSEDPLYNIKLAARRAIKVFEHFQYRLNIDPTRHLMSATSFGEYKPVQRKDSDMQYNASRLKEDNDTNEKYDKNRRIEVVLIYRRKH